MPHCRCAAAEESMQYLPKRAKIVRLVCEQHHQTVDKLDLMKDLRICPFCNMLTCCRVATCRMAATPHKTRVTVLP